MRTRIAAVVPAFLAVAALATPVSPAYAHQGNPNFRSSVTAITPETPGVSAEIVNLDDRLVVTSEDGHTVEIDGYKDEPYARILPDGTVQLNRRSPSYYLNEDRFANADVPPSADPDAEPEWETVGSSGRLEFHDHRIHWMAQGTPPQVKDEGERTKVFDWTVPMVVDGTPAEIEGELLWEPDESGFPVAAIFALAGVALAAGAFVLVIRRRRGDGGGEAKEAW